MKNCLPVVILAQPAGLQRHAAWFTPAAGMSNESFPQSSESFRKISEDFSGDFALVAARPKDARNQDPAWSFRAQWRVGSFEWPAESMTDGPSIFKDFQRKPFVQLHPGSAEKRSHRFGCPSLPPDHLAQVFRMHSQFQHGDLRPVDRLHPHFLGMVHECPGDGFNQFLHRVPGDGAPGEAGDAQISGRRRTKRSSAVVGNYARYRWAVLLDPFNS